MISSFCSDNDCARRRVEGLKDACTQNGLDASAIQVVETGGAAFAGFMAQDQKRTAVLCGNDVLAVGALQQAKKIGLRVPMVENSGPGMSAKLETSLCLRESLI